MKVRELIEELENIDPELDLRMSCHVYGDGWCDEKDVRGVQSISINTSNEGGDFALIWPDPNREHSECSCLN